MTSIDCNSLKFGAEIEPEDSGAMRKQVCIEGSMEDARFHGNPLSPKAGLVLIPFLTRFLLLVIMVRGGGTAYAEIRYNRDVLPILSAKCFACHGADKARRKAELRLDVRQEALAERDRRRAIVPGKPEQSELIRRIFTMDADEAMPPADKGEPLDEKEKQTLKQWIAEGAVYEKHWALLAPKKMPVPDAGQWGNNQIDGFIYEQLVKSRLAPQKPAPREPLIRRVSLDLTGLPPSIEEVDAFLADHSDRAYERVVDRLLKSPRYGERMAMWWLDGARYGDSHGYDNDLENSQWPWRDWVIEAFNNNKPFDQFTIEQLAGDLLPDAREDQVLATGFNRNHRIQTEDGAIDEEWRTEYVIDRVETMGAVWMGLTLSCARCHDHKYDPISQREFYQLFALFNNLDEKGFINNLRGSAEPRVPYQSKKFEREAAAIKAQLTEKAARDKALAELESRYPKAMVMVMREMQKPRKAFVLVRGQYDRPGNEVTPGLPETLPPLPEDEQVTRLSLAKWLVNGRHPLTARVVVNRLWEQMYGIGIVESSENLGVQADWPSHRELLDWLAVDFFETGWDVKGLLKKMVMSAAYRQSHVVDARRLTRDPRNRLLSRGPRVRLQAEMVRDQALAISGLLFEQVGGPSVRPYQPAGLWEEVEKRGKYQQSHGNNLYRRSLYTAIRRTVAPPGMVLFDLPSREVCTVRRSRTNTPLQALALMNGVTYVEAAKKLAERMMPHGAAATERIAWGFRCVTLRRAKQIELDVLLGGYERRLSVYRKTPAAAAALLKQGESQVSDAYDEAELAAMTTIANILLNLDEIINK
ncbi:MAG: PSD1 and planctomycete cytochrome C domain-containing protein [Pirellulales bacterium]